MLKYLLVFTYNIIKKMIDIKKFSKIILLSSLISVTANAEIIKPLDVKPYRTGLLISGLALATTAYGVTSWWGDSSSQFRVRHEGWFGEDSPNGGADKLGHGFSFYLSTRLLSKGFQWAGHDSRKAAQLAGLTSAALSIGVEIMDGFTNQYGFSPEDVAMNLLGIGAGVFLESHPKLDRLFDIRVQYWPSDDARRLNDYDPVADYSGQTYLLVTKASGIPMLNKNKYLRYLEFDFGYGTRGYQPTDGTGTQPKERNIYYGISVNLSQLLNDTILKSNTTTRKITNSVLEYVQVPGTALLFKHKL
jgi:hypothetical protein